MHEMNFLPDLVLLITVAILIIVIFQRFKIPSVIGLILTGVVLGPSGFRIVDDMDVINSLSELGVVLLLFTIGLEFSLAELSKLKSICRWWTSSSYYYFRIGANYVFPLSFCYVRNSISKSDFLWNCICRK